MLLFLVSFAQAFAAERKLPFEKEILAFEASDRTNPPPKGAVLFVGSSSIRLWTNLAQCFPRLTIVQRGFGGSCLPDSTAYAERIIIPYQPSKILVYAGDNDIARGDSPAEVASHFREFVQKIQSELRKTQIYFIAVKPSPSRWSLSPQAREVNALVRDYCTRNKGLKFIDVWEPMLNSNGQPEPSLFRADNLHMNGKGYELWTKIIGAALKDG
ncbi:MAG TPA: SGNH/GDSL hydrolase family protein [Verrucomicrobiae bacterium]|nr:SGNH/GDSL hydrolase family protein [Verrucomicrobiae bacterium]